LGAADTFGIELRHPRREARADEPIGAKELSNHRWIVGAKLAYRNNSSLNCRVCLVRTLAPVVTISKRRLGRTGLEVSELGLGGWRFIARFNVPRTQAYAILDTAYSAGINFVDTAASYGCGESQELIGRWMTKTGRTMYVSTKIGMLDNTMLREVTPAAYQDEEMLLRLIEHNLHLLRQDRLDILLIHEPENPHWGFDRRTGDAPVMLLLERLKREGAIGAIGLGGSDNELLADLVETGRVDVVLSFMHYDLAVQDIRRRLLPMIQRHDVGLILGGPFRQGALGRRLPKSALERMRKTGDYLWGFNELVLKKVEKLYTLCDETGMSLTELGLRYLLSDSTVSTVIPGPKSVQHVQLNIAAAAQGPLSGDLVRQIETLD